MGTRLRGCDGPFVAPAAATRLWAGAQFLALAVLLAACGFQLRGETATGLRTLHVPGGGVAQEIRRTLAGSPTRVLLTPEGAEAVLQIMSENRDKAVNTITGSGRVYEYSLTLVVRYRMTVPGREDPIIPPTETSTRRLITYSEAAPIAKEAEEQLLFKDMQLELADRILRQVSIAKRDM